MILGTGQPSGPTKEITTMPYLFSRRGRLAPGNTLDAMTWAGKITEKVNAISEVPVTLWTTEFSPEVGTLSWTTLVEDLSQLTALQAKLAADNGYLTLVEEGARYTSDAGLDDGLVDLVHADPDAATGEYASVVTAIVAPGSFVRGIEVGVEIAQRAKAIMGRATSFGTSQTGVYGAVGWIVLYDSVDELQAASKALNSNVEFAQYLDEHATTAYIPGMSTQTIFRKLS
jgi:hypothetical protein